MGVADAEPMKTDPVSRISEILVARGYCDETALGRAKAVIAQPSPTPPLSRQRPEEAQKIARIGEALISLGLLAPETWADAVAECYRLPRADRTLLQGEPMLDVEGVSPDFFHAEPAILMRGAHPLLVVSHPSDPLPLQALTLILGDAPTLAVASEKEIKGALDRVAYSEAHSQSGTTDLQILRTRAEEGPIITYVNALIVDSESAGASDIHIEPHEHGLSVRIRCEGVMREVDPPPANSTPAVISRIKIMAGLDIAERRRPQDGRAQISLPGQTSHGTSRELDLRVATSPSLHGETVVLRLLRRDAEPPALNALGASTTLQAKLESIIQRTNGLVLITGPTGSGKTTTLYALLGKLASAERKIITVEDPIEYQVSGVTQIQVQTELGFGFAEALRTLVRHNPDILMIGETRDALTAKTALQSALTGHLVMSSLHTNDASSAIARLGEMGVEAYVIASALSAVIAQRLVRVLCPHCSIPADRADTERSLAALMLPTQDMRGARKAVGCRHCSEGYLGRQAVFEYVEMDETLQSLVMLKAPAGEIRAAARNAGVGSLTHQGLAMAARGETSLDEVMRAIGPMP